MPHDPNDKLHLPPSETAPGPAEAAADSPPQDPGRRKFLGTTALAGVAGAGSGLLGGLATARVAHAASPAISMPEDYVAPGKLDEYYGIWSGGHTGEVRILGLPSMREFTRVPVFNMDYVTGWGITNQSKRVLGERYPLGGDSHHPHMSMVNGHYDGRYIFINDKANTRVARIRCDVMRCDKMVSIPNAQAIHGMRPQRVPRTKYVFCNAEFRVPHPNDGRFLDDPTKYFTVFTAVDADSWEVAWQVIVDGNLDNTESDYAGKYAISTCYNSEGATDLAGMMRSERDWAVVFNVPRIEEAIRDGHYTHIGSSKVPVVDGRHGSRLTLYVPVPKNPHGINATPDGKYVIASGKLSPTTTVMSWALIDDWFAGKLKDPRDVVVAEPQLGLGPLHTAYDGRGNAYTTLFIDSQVAMWNIEDAIHFYRGEKVNYIRQKLDVAYQPGHNHSSMGETRDADGRWLVSLNKFSKDRFLPHGPLHANNDQLIDISQGQMRLVADTPEYQEPHDCAIIHRRVLFDKVKRIWDRNDPFFADALQQARRDGVVLERDNKVIREGRHVRVYMTCSAPQFGMDHFEVNKGDEVTVTVTSQDSIENLTNGWCLADYGVNMEINPQQTSSVTFIADKPGVHWYYCPFFCHALHLEMRGRMLVKA